MIPVTSNSKAENFSEEYSNKSLVLHIAPFWHWSYISQVTHISYVNEEHAIVKYVCPFHPVSTSESNVSHPFCFLILFLNMNTWHFTSNLVGAGQPFPYIRHLSRTNKFMEKWNLTRCMYLCIITFWFLYMFLSWGEKFWLNTMSLHRNYLSVKNVSGGI